MLRLSHPCTREVNREHGWSSAGRRNWWRVLEAQGGCNSLWSGGRMCTDWGGGPCKLPKAPCGPGYGVVCCWSWWRPAGHGRGARTHKRPLGAGWGAARWRRSRCGWMQRAGCVSEVTRQLMGRHRTGLSTWCLKEKSNKFRKRDHRQH